MDFNASVISALFGAGLAVGVQLVVSMIRWVVNRRVESIDANERAIDEAKKRRELEVDEAIRTHAATLSKHGQQLDAVKQAHEEMSKRLDMVSTSNTIAHDAFRTKVDDVEKKFLAVVADLRSDFREGLLEMRADLKSLSTTIDERTHRKD